MKKRILKLINRLFKFKGYTLIRIYELTYLRGKYGELISEMEKNFIEIFHDFPVNEKRKLLISRLYGTGVSESLYLIYYLNKALGLRGDVCEYGVANGATSALIASEINKTKKSLWLFDSFKGLSKPTYKDKLINDIFGLGSMDKYKGTMNYEKSEVLEKLRAIRFPRKRTIIIEGYIENTIKQKLLPKKVCFAFIDFDLYEPIKVALNFLNKTIVKGGYILIDDYGYFSEGAKLAVDEFYATNKDSYNFLKPKKFAGYFCVLQRVI